MTLALLAAFAASVCYGVASVLQGLSAQRTVAADGLDARLLVRLAGQVPYVAGLALDLVGFGLSVVALQSLPLFLVESVLAGSVGVTAVVAVAAFGLHLHRAEVVALGVLVAGLVLLAAGALPGPGRPMPTAGQWVLLTGVPAVLLGGAAGVRARGRVGAVVIAALAGAAFAGVGVAARGLVVPSPWWRAATMPSVWALVAYGLLGTLLFATALQRGSVVVASAVTFTVETVVPSAVGIAVLGDETRPGGGAACSATGFVLALAAAVALAPHAEPSAPTTPAVSQRR